MGDEKPAKEMLPAEAFALGGEDALRINVGHAGTRVGLRIAGAKGTMQIFLGAAQARELALSLMMMADNVSQWEGIEGNVRRDASVVAPNIRMSLPAGGRT